MPPIQGIAALLAQLAGQIPPGGIPGVGSLLGGGGLAGGGPQPPVGFPGIGLGGGGGGIIGMEQLGNPSIGGLFTPPAPLANVGFQTPGQQSFSTPFNGAEALAAAGVAPQPTGAAPPQALPPVPQPQPGAGGGGPSPGPLPPVPGAQGGGAELLGPPVSVGGPPAPSALPPEILPYVAALASGAFVPGHSLPPQMPPVPVGGGGDADAIFQSPPVPAGGGATLSSGAGESAGPPSPLPPVPVGEPPGGRRRRRPRGRPSRARRRPPEGGGGPSTAQRRRRAASIGGGNPGGVTERERALRNRRIGGLF